MSCMFSYCSSLTSLNLSNTHNVNNMSCMFSYCSLTSLNLSNTHNVKDMSIKAFILLKLIKINFLVNCILTSLKEYILDDISYLNIDTNTLYSFLLLPFLEHY